MNKSFQQKVSDRNTITSLSLDDVARSVSFTRVKWLAPSV